MELRTSEENPEKQLIWTHKGSQRLRIDNQGARMGPLHIGYNCVTWSTCETPNTESNGCLWLFCLLLESISPTGLPHPILIGEEEPGLTATWYTMAVIHGSLAPIWRETEREEWERNLEERKERNFGCDVKTKTGKQTKRKAKQTIFNRTSM